MSHKTVKTVTNKFLNKQNRTVKVDEREERTTNQKSVLFGCGSILVLKSDILR